MLSAAVSLDGYLDDATADRLILSNAADLDRVDALRADADAIMVGAGTIRADDPRLLIRSARRRAERVARGLPESPTKVTLTSTPALDPQTRFFTAGDSSKIVYGAAGAVGELAERLGRLATVIDAGPTVDLRAVLADLHGRGVNRLLVEGGGTVHAQFLLHGLADELQLVTAPFLSAILPRRSSSTRDDSGTPPPTPCVWRRPAPSAT